MFDILGASMVCGFGFGLGALAAYGVYSAINDFCDGFVHSARKARVREEGEK